MTRQDLRAERNKLGLTIEEMAKALKTPHGTYKKWENGDRRVPGIVDVAILQVRREFNAISSKQHEADGKAGK